MVLDDNYCSALRIKERTKQRLFTAKSNEAAIRGKPVSYDEILTKILDIYEQTQTAEDSE